LGGNAPIVAESGDIFTPNQGSFSVEMWISVASTAAQEKYIIHYESDTVGFYVRLSFSNLIGFFAVVDNSVTGLTLAMTLNTSTWNHVGLTFDWNNSTSTGEYLAYLDGVGRSLPLSIVVELLQIAAHRSLLVQITEGNEALMVLLMRSLFMMVLHLVKHKCKRYLMQG